MRSARQKSANGIYHVMIRGINRQDIFYDEEDYSHFLEITKRIIEKESCSIYGYCLMGNHVHILLREQNQEVSVAMQRIGTSYAMWYNKRYDRVGQVFQNRFQSEVINTEKYLFGVLRYIHNNPVKAKLTVKPEEYMWSSCQAYYKGEDVYGLVDTDFILAQMSNHRETAVQEFINFMKQENEDEFMEVIVRKRKNDKQLAEEIQTLLAGESIISLQNLEKGKRDELIRRIKGMEGVSQRQIARVTGIHPSIIFKA